MVKAIKIVRGIKRRATKILVPPTVDQPMHVLHDGIDVLRFLFRRVGVVHSNVADAIELVRNPEIQANRLGMTDMKIAVGFRRKTSFYPGVFSCPQILRHNFADEIGWSWSNSQFGHCNCTTVADESADRQLLRR